MHNVLHELLISLSIPYNKETDNNIIPIFSLLNDCVILPCYAIK